MLKKILLFALPVLFILFACNNSKNEGSTIPGMSQFDLSDFGALITINVPDTTKTKLEMSAQGSGSIIIKSGKNFQISVTPGDGDFQLKKSDISSDDVKKFKRYVVDEPATLIWESQISGLDPEFHFFMVTTAGKDSYLIEDIKEGDAFSENAILKMVEAAKSIKAKEAGNS